ncbi:hypothetical protein QAD02_017394 [Eretmocerus hayati]|uniref:Uncharacterized protein n=1 Tax=Eretmocerus hayati TaxID=131215 RepID=A0ACC2PDR2_9HYME|nr:hypothetical protein QAD02_017394 [Eretmocerus hayati]
MGQNKQRGQIAYLVSLQSATATCRVAFGTVLAADAAALEPIAVISRFVRQMLVPHRDKPTPGCPDRGYRHLASIHIPHNNKVPPSPPPNHQPSVAEFKEDTMELHTLFPQNTNRPLTTFESHANGNRKSSPTTMSTFSGIGSDNWFFVAQDPHEDAILADGIERFCNDLQLSPDEFKVLVLAWKLNAEQMCRFTREEFVVGLKSMKVDSIKGIQMHLPELVQELVGDGESFKDLYRFTFRFGLDVSSGQRILPADMAIVLWRLVFTIREPPLLDRWLNFLECHHVRGIPRDTWNMFLNFAESIGDDLGLYNDFEAWPSLFDDFVEYQNDCQNQNITKEDLIKDSSAEND